MPLRILHAEDSSTDAELTARLLRHEFPGCSVTRVTSEEEMAGELQKAPFEVVLSDFTLGTFDGFTALEISRRYCPLTPFIFLSGTLGEERAVEAVKRGATDYVLKDRPGRLITSIRNAIAHASEIERRKEAEAQFLRAQRMESLGLSVGNIAHDLNNVFAPILMSLGLIKASLGDKTALRLVEGIETNASYGTALVRQLLAFARGAEGQHVVTDLRLLVTDFAPVIRTALSRGVPIELEAGAETPLVLADATQLKQVLMNLCLNARDAMPEGGAISLTVGRFMVKPGDARMHPNSKPGRYAVLSVADTGSGIPTADLDRIFDPFYTTKAPDQGTGLGLSTVRGIVKGHGGFITVDSEVGRGTIFRIYLPSATSGSTLTPWEPPAEFHRPKGVLLVDDDEAVLSTTELMLTSWGYIVYPARGGESALQSFAELRDSIDVILTDMQMTEIDGLALIARVRELAPGFPVVGVTGMSGTARFEQGLSALGTTLITKPMGREILSRAIEAAIQGGSAARATCDC